LNFVCPFQAWEAAMIDDVQLQIWKAAIIAQSPLLVAAAVILYIQQ
jgi:hypothetical protein